MKQAIPGIAGIKPRVSRPEGAGKAAREESHALDAEYRRGRNETLRLKNMQAQMLLAKARGELVEKRLVQLQAEFLLIAMRRQVMTIPQALCDRLAAVGDPEEVKAILDEAMRSLLSELQELPNRIDPEEWAKFLAEEEGGAAAESEEEPAKAKTPRRRPK